MAEPAERIMTFRWVLPTGDRLVATLTYPDRIETVTLDGHIISRSPPGGRPEGHPLRLGHGHRGRPRVAGGPEYREPPVDARVRFEGLTCKLTLGGDTIDVPRAAPDAPGPAAGAEMRWYDGWGGAAALVLFFVLAGLFLYATRPEPGSECTRCFKSSDCKGTLSCQSFKGSSTKRCASGNSRCR